MQRDLLDIYIVLYCGNIDCIDCFIVCYLIFLLINKYYLLGRCVVFLME